ncbi:MAG: hypothetical protein HY964_02405 [Ignavibacteriales bacterium]|nr:hypothetical protein [Ignavibacteriales bacterium]
MRIFTIILLIIILENPLIGQQELVENNDSLETDIRTEEIIEQITPDEDSPVYDFIEDGKRISGINIQIRNRFFQPLQRQAGYIDKSYLGLPQKIYHRLKIQSGDKISGGILTEKDAGEVHYADFVSYNIAFKNVGPLSKIILGDYIVESGLGLVLWRSYGMMKGSDVESPVMKRAEGIRPYLSSGESGYFRGSAIEFVLGDFKLIVFLSSVNKSVSYDTLNNVTSIYSAGLFRTENEISKKNNFNEKSFGSHLKYYIGDNGTIGFTFFRSFFSNPLLIDGGKKFNARSVSFFSTDYLLNISMAKLFGEFAYSNSVLSGINGISISPAKSFSIIAAYRNYPYKYFSLNGNPFGEKGADENGFYIGVAAKISSGVRVSVYRDLFRFNDSNSSRFGLNGSDLLCQTEFIPVKSTLISFRYRQKKTDESYEKIDGGGFLRSAAGVAKREQYRLNADHSLSELVKIRGRVELNILHYASAKNEKGIMFYGDIIYSAANSIAINLRTIYFRSDSFESGIYEYERDIEGVFSLPVLYGKGLRWYLFLKYQPSDLIVLSVKYSNHIRDDIKRIGSGNDQLPSNTDERVGVQIDLKF